MNNIRQEIQKLLNTEKYIPTIKNDVSIDVLKQQVDRLEELHQKLKLIVNECNDEQLKKLTGQIVEGNLVCDTLISALKNIITEKNECTALVSKYKSENNELKTKINLYNEEKNELLKNIKFLKNSLDEQSLVLRDKGNNKSKTNQELEIANQELETIKTNLKEKNDQLKKELNAIQSVLNEKDKQIEQTKKILSKTENQLSKANLTNKDLERVIQNIEEKLKHKTESLSICQGELNRLILENKKLSKDYKLNFNNANHYKKLNDSLSKQNEFLNSQLTNYIKMKGKIKNNEKVGQEEVNLGEFSKEEPDFPVFHSFDENYTKIVDNQNKEDHKIPENNQNVFYDNTTSTAMTVDSEIIAKNEKMAKRKAFKYKKRLKDKEKEIIKIRKILNTRDHEIEKLEEELIAVRRETKQKFKENQKITDDLLEKFDQLLRDKEVTKKEDKSKNNPEKKEFNDEKISQKINNDENKFENNDPIYDTYKFDVDEYNFMNEPVFYDFDTTLEDDNKFKANIKNLDIAKETTEKFVSNKDNNYKKDNLINEDEKNELNEVQKNFMDENEKNFFFGNNFSFKNWFGINKNTNHEDNYTNHEDNYNYHEDNLAQNKINENNEGGIKKENVENKTEKIERLEFDHEKNLKNNENDFNCQKNNLSRSRDKNINQTVNDSKNVTQNDFIEETDKLNKMYKKTEEADSENTNSTTSTLKHMKLKTEKLKTRFENLDKKLKQIKDSSLKDTDKIHNQIKEYNTYYCNG
ncbi:hypothetical protein DMUE_5353, partial [Dictyocoela muelleri]